MRVGLLGGSFNPAHEGHRHIAELALARLGLDQVWLLVSPGNPLKPVAGMAPLADRMKGAAAIGDGAGRCQPFGQRGHAMLRFQRVTRRNHQPDLVKPEPSARQLSHMAMACMRRVE